MTVELDIEKLVQGGDGLARLPAAADGRREPVFIPFVLPGERVRVELGPRAGGRRTARLLEVLAPAPERIAPGCEYFTHCGGCQLQHTSPEHQITLKRDILLETLARTGGVRWAGEVALHPSPPWAYRNRIRLQAVPAVGVGYWRADSHRVLPVTHCPIASPALDQAVARFAAEPVTRREEVELAANNDDQGLDSQSPLEFEVAGFRYRVSNGAFFQVNRFLTPALVESVTGNASGACALDLFSGVGLFALPLARHFRQIEAVEANAVAAGDLRHNAEGGPIRVAALEAAAYLAQRPSSAPVPDFVVADPPRAGLGRELARALAALGPAELRLLSCDAATLGRDLALLLAAGYTLESLELFDLFPQTAHIETLARLRR
ncbi:MAG: class I SAM-dependent RNA methyltransferase [Terriglobales bacterium]